MIGGVDVTSILIRALIVLILFALFGSAVNFVAVTFLNEGSSDSNVQTNPESGQDGSRVNIVLSEDDETISELTAESDDEDITIQKSEAVAAGSNSDLGERSRQVNSEMSTSMDIDTLPDLGSFSTSFSSSDNNEEKKTEPGEESGYNEDNSFSSGSRLSPEGLAGTIAEQNSPEDIAKAVKTVMNRQETK